MYLPERLQEVPGQIVVFSAVRKSGDDIGLKADSVSDPAAETKVTPEEQALTKNESHAVFYALSDDAESFLIEQGMGEQVYEANDEICSYLVPVELVREMAQQGLLTETGMEMTALDDVAEGSVIVVVRMAEVQP